MLREFKAAHVLMNERVICIETYSGRGLMGRDPDGICDFRELDEANATLGSLLRRALEASRWISLEEYPLFFDIERSKETNRLWVEAACQRSGFKSRKALFKEMMSCSVRCAEGRITIKPSVHVKLEGWTGDGIAPTEYVELSTEDSDEALGEGIRLALSRCR
ncbi:contact-dependent growth inhibition system immunity protein [Luteibacter sp. Lutesp34]|uniref:contact-dependent growth inhibition system immunity protein n=1 Tax=Luteibacter sp. Lutesp34 TaxID=3243030 RepID=UPI0039B664D6